MNIQLISFTNRGEGLANRLAEGLAGEAMRCGRPLSLDAWTRQSFLHADGLIFVGAAGIAVRAIAPYVKSKAQDPAVVVVDATCLERNLNLVLQTLEITQRVVVCLNLMDEAEKKGIQVDLEELSLQLGVPVVATSARSGKGLEELMDQVEAIAFREKKTYRVKVDYGPQPSPCWSQRSLRSRTPLTAGGLPCASWMERRSCWPPPKPAWDLTCGGTSK